MVAGIMLLVVVLLGVWLFRGSRKWEVLLSATGSNGADVEAMYAYFKSNKIKCKLVTDDGPVGSTSYMDPHNGMPNSAGTVIKLKVHRKHLELAKQLMETYQEEAL